MHTGPWLELAGQMTRVAIPQAARQSGWMRLAIIPLLAALLPTTTARAQPATPPVVAPRLVGLPGFADLVARVRPAVVTITATSTEAQAPPSRQVRPLARREARQVQALGSGFLIDAAGYVVTNHHVVRGATNVSVSLDDGRHLPARIIGTDPWTDLAVLRIEAGAALPWLSLGDSDRVRPGDWVVAMGNPFGLDGSVTAGIVSARGRNIGQGPYDDYFQVDAAINTGNSGGPLFATDGSVVGVNSAIYTPGGGGGSVGIGFAIPAQLVREVVTAIRAEGRVERGFLGATAQSLTPALAGALGMPGVTGALVDDVVPNSPAARSGLRAGDVVLGADGQPLADARALARLVAATRAGNALVLTVRRDGLDQFVLARMVAAPDHTDRAQPMPERQPPRFGMTLAPIAELLRRDLRLPRDLHGALVTALAPGGGAALAGVRVGDILVGIGQQEVADAADALRGLGALPSGPVVLRVLRSGAGLYVAVP